MLSEALIVVIIFSITFILYVQGTKAIKRETKKEMEKREKLPFWYW